MLEYAKNELKKLEETCEDAESSEMQKVMSDNVLALLEVFSKQGHTNTTAYYVADLFARLVRQKPLTQLTGEADEWNDISDISNNPKWQNKRCPTVFKYADGSCWYSEGKIFSDNGGETYYLSKDSSIEITFPFTVPEDPERIILSYGRKQEIESLKRLCQLAGVEVEE